MSKHYVPKLVLGFIKPRASIEQVLDITDDLEGIEACLQDFDVQKIDGYRHEGGGGGIAGIESTRGLNCRVIRRGNPAARFSISSSVGGKIHLSTPEQVHAQWD